MTQITQMRFSTTEDTENTEKRNKDL